MLYVFVQEKADVEQLGSLFALSDLSYSFRQSSSSRYRYHPPMLKHYSFSRFKCANSSLLKRQPASAAISVASLLRLLKINFSHRSSIDTSSTVNLDRCSSSQGFVPFHFFPAARFISTLKSVPCGTSLSNPSHAPYSSLSSPWTWNGLRYASVSATNFRSSDPAGVDL